MTVPKVSVIVPVFNAQKSLCYCIDSLIGQTLSDIEIILVNDGSIDSSTEICDDYAHKDKRIKVIHQENAGVSAARNAGLDIAAGEYISFCDSDDALTSNALELMLGVASDVQMVVGDIEYISINAKMHKVHRSRHYGYEYRRLDLMDSKAIFEFWKANNMVSACAKLYRGEMIRRHEIRFDTDLIVLEDYSFVLDYLSYCSQICMIHHVVYECFSYADIALSERRSRKDFFDDAIIVSKRLSSFLNRINADKSQQILSLSIYPTLLCAYDLLWEVEASSVAAKMKKYARIKQAVSSEEFQKMLVEHKARYSKMEYFFLKRKTICGVLFSHMINRLRPQKK